MIIQFNIMDGLKQVRKKDFIKIFTEKHPAVRSKELEKDLTAVNRDFNIILYHNKGFLIKWKDLIISGINFGDYISSFNIDDPASIVTVGGNFTYDYSNDYYKGMTYGIHPNIYRKNTSLQLPTVVNGNIIKICFYNYQPQIITSLTSKGLIHAALQIPRGIFNNNEKYDGLWNGFKIRRCSICDDCMDGYIDKGNTCKKCGGGNTDIQKNDENNNDDDEEYNDNDE